MLEYLAVYPETLRLIKRYGKADRYDLLEAQAEYAYNRSEPSWPDEDLKWFVWEALKQQVDRVLSKSEQNRANGSRRKRTEANESEPERNVANVSEPERNEANPPKEKEKEKDIYTAAGTARAQETVFGPVEIDPVIVAVQRDLVGLTMSHYAELDSYRENLPDDLIIEAVNEAVAHGARTWAYVRTVLDRYRKENIRSVAEAKASAERRKQAGKQGGKRVTAQQYTQRHYSENELDAQCEDL